MILRVKQDCSTNGIQSNLLFFGHLIIKIDRHYTGRWLTWLRGWAGRTRSLWSWRWRRSSPGAAASTSAPPACPAGAAPSPSWQHEACITFLSGDSANAVPHYKNYAAKFPMFGEIVGVNRPAVQWNSLVLGELPPWSQLAPQPGKYACTENTPLRTTRFPMSNLLNVQFGHLCSICCLLVFYWKKFYCCHDVLQSQRRIFYFTKIIQKGWHQMLGQFYCSSLDYNCEVELIWKACEISFVCQLCAVAIQ